MITFIPEVVTQDEVAQLAAVLAGAAFADGAVSAGWHAREVKKNQQLAHGMPGYEAAGKLVHGALERNTLFQMAARPRFLMPVMFNRYAPGMSYGAHIDDPIMGTSGQYPGRLRADVAYTLFLADPASYQGGELVIEPGGAAEQRFKLAPGALVLYPATTLHRVNPVTEGVRLAAVGWVQSELRDPAKRAILFDLDLVRRTVFQAEGKSRQFDLLSKAHANLLQMWAEL